MWKRKVLSILLLAVAAAQDEQTTAPSDVPSDVPSSVPSSAPLGIYIVELRPASDTQKLAVRACAGLFNRDESIAGAVYLLESNLDEGWFEDVITLDYTAVSHIDFLWMCLQNRDIVEGYLRYSWSQQQALLPNIVTLSGVLNLIPIDEGDWTLLDINNMVPDLPLLFDALNNFRGFSGLEATRFVFESYGQQTTAMAKMNPGYLPPDDSVGQLQPELAGTVEMGLADFVIKERLFAFFLWFGCIGGFEEEEFVSIMADPVNNNWPNPIPVYGYDSTFTVGGRAHIFEASTNCVDSSNMGTIPTRDVSNLSFFSRIKASNAQRNNIDKEQNQEPKKLRAASSELVYDPEKTYIAFVVGDGDNIEFVKGDRRRWMQDRVQYCSGATDGVRPMSLADGRLIDTSNECYPVLWSMSPQVVTLAPEMWQWYQDQAQLATGGKDSFVLPPSGHFYSYPTLMPPETQAEYVRLTELDAQNLNTNALVAWDMIGTWPTAFTEYLPRYLQNGIITAVLAINVPYMIPIFASAFTDTYQVLEENGNKLAVFYPFFWRGTDERDAPEHHLSVDNMASFLNEYEKGAVNFIYTSSDGGFTMSNLHDLMPKLADHVQFVDSQQLASLAFQREEQAAWWEELIPDDVVLDIIPGIRTLFRMYRTAFLILGLHSLVETSTTTPSSSPSVSQVPSTTPSLRPSTSPSSTPSMDPC